MLMSYVLSIILPPLGIANIQQVLVPLVHVLAIVLMLKTQLQVALFALVAHDQLVCCSIAHTHKCMADNIADACTCEKASDGGVVPNELETDFTTKA